MSWKQTMLDHLKHKVKMVNIAAGFVKKWPGDKRFEKQYQEDLASMRWQYAHCIKCEYIK